jgi:methyl-accepting chemotaxis protein
MTTTTATRLDELTAEIAGLDEQLRRQPHAGENAASRTRLRWRKELAELESLRLYRDARDQKKQAAEAELAEAAAELEQVELEMKHTAYGKLALRAQAARAAIGDAQYRATDLRHEVGHLTGKVHELAALAAASERQAEKLESA